LPFWYFEPRKIWQPCGRNRGHFCLLLKSLQLSQLVQLQITVTGTLKASFLRCKLWHSVSAVTSFINYKDTNFSPMYLNTCGSSTSLPVRKIWSVKARRNNMITMPWRRGLVVSSPFAELWIVSSNPARV
jgi:hypothetical protein